MKKLLLFSICILVFILGLGGVSGATLTTFNNSLGIENISFAGDENVTRYIELNRYAIVDSAYFNISGFESPNQTESNEDNTEDSWNYSRWEIDVHEFADENWGTAWDVDDGAGYHYAYENYTIPSFLVNATAKFKFWVYDRESNNYWATVKCMNQTSPGWIILYQRYSGDETIIFTEYANVHDDCLTGSTLEMQTSVHNMHYLYNWLSYYDGAIIWNTTSNFSNISNPYVEVGALDGSYEWNATGNYTDLNNRTDDFSSILNTALDGGDCTGGTLNGNNCVIPTMFHSDTIGILQYSDIDIEYNYFTVSNCTGGNITLNLTIYDEPNQEPMIGDIEAFFEINTQEYYFDLEGQSEYLFCLDPATDTAQADGTIEYTNSSGYVIRTYYLNNMTLSNDTVNIPLYLLTIAESEAVVIETADENYDELVGVFAKMQRLYIGTNTWETVEVGKSDTQGKTIIHAVLEDVFYRFIFEEEGGTVLESTEPMKFYCVDGYECKYTFIIGEDIDSPFSPVNGLPGVSYSLIYDNTTNSIRFEWSDSTGATQTGRLLLISKTLEGDNIICDTQLNSVSGTLYCPTSNLNGTFFYYGYIYRSPGKIVEWGTFSKSAYSLIFGTEGVVWAIILIITVFLIGIWNPVASIILGTVTFAGLAIIGVLDLGYGIIVAIAIMGALLIWRMRT